MNISSKEYLERLQKSLSELDMASFDKGIAVIERTWKEGKQIITLGNGGSSITALHFITDWNKSVFLSTGRPFRGRSLADNLGILTAYGNDISFADIFSEQLKNIMQPGDLVVAISGSGNSENVIRAVEYANANSGITLGLCGFDGGRLKKIVHHAVWANIDDMQLVEDIHVIFGHMVLRALGDYHPGNKY